jgi:H+/Cl- antiporter ClcA
MNAAGNSEFQTKEAAEFGRMALGGGPEAARGGVVNRTHRVVRERAKAMQEKRSRDRSLMLPLVLCSALLLLTAFAVWFGLGQYQGVEAVSATSLSSPDSNHFLLVMLWFVPVSIVLLATLWVRRSRAHDGDGAL